MAALTEGASFREREQVKRLLGALRDAITVADQQLPACIGTFVAHALLALTARPPHSQYKPINSFLLSRPYLQLDEPPMFFASFHAGGERARDERLWSLALLRGGLRTDADVALVAKRHILQLLLAAHSSPICEAPQLRRATELVLQRAAALPAAAERLAAAHGAFGWARLHLERLARDGGAAGARTDAVLRLLELCTRLVRAPSFARLPAHVGRQCGDACEAAWRVAAAAAADAAADADADSGGGGGLRPQTAVAFARLLAALATAADAADAADAPAAALGALSATTWLGTFRALRQAARDRGAGGGGALGGHAWWLALLGDARRWRLDGAGGADATALADFAREGSEALWAAAPLHAVADAADAAVGGNGGLVERGLPLRAARGWAAWLAAALRSSGALRAAVAADGACAAAVLRLRRWPHAAAAATPLRALADPAWVAGVREVARDANRAALLMVATRGGDGRALVPPLEPP